MQLADDERDELRSSARRFLDNEQSSARVRALLDDERGHDPTVWSAMAALGWLAIHVPEEHGGMGASYTDLAVVLHEIGRHVAPTPFLATLLGIEALLAGGSDALRSAWLPSMLGGERILTVANSGPSGGYDPAALGVTWRAGGGDVRFDGVARFAPDAHVADAIVVLARGDAGVTAAVVDRSAPGVRVELEPTVDQTRRLARVSFDGVAVREGQLLGEPGSSSGLQHRLTSVGAVAVCADAVGAAERMLEVSAAYAKERLQFGRPVGSFQAVKHHCANMLIAVEGSRAAVAHATDVLDDPAEALALAAAVAKSYAGSACADACQTAVQVHGGIGFTWEHDAHLYLKRTKLDEAMFGSTAWHRRRLGGALVAG